MHATATRARTLLTAVLAVLASAVMALAMFAGTAKAEEASCSVTIENANVGQTYTIYKIFDLTTTEDGTGYSYTIPADDDRVALVDAVKNNANLSDLFSSLNDPEYFQVVDGKLSSETAKSDLVGIIKSLIEQGDVFEAVGTDKATGTTLIFSGLEPGYYFISTTTGTLCTLDTTTGTVNVQDKNTVPTLTKQVRFVESAADTAMFPEETTFAATTSAGFGDTVEYQVKVTLHEGDTNIALHDKIASGIDFDKGTIKVTKNDGTELTLGEDYTVAANGLITTFDLTLTEAGLAKVNGTEGVAGGFIVTYQGKLNQTATVGGTGNANAAYLTFGSDATETATATATVYTYSITVNKVDENDKALAGAVFALSTQDNADTNLKFAAAAQGTTTYPVDETSTTYQITTDETGAFTITGLKPGTYHLAELQSPDGYNLLPESQTITLTADNYTTAQKIINHKGTVLPGTGGIGTTVFYVVGGVLVAGAVVALVAKKKMSANK